MNNPPVNRTLIITLAQTPDHTSACLTIAGDVDLAGEAALAGAAKQLAATPCTRWYIDLGGITFAGSALINFLHRLSAQLPGDGCMTLCRPTAMAVHLIALTGLHELATVRADLPADWRTPQPAAGAPTILASALA